jgi:pimeloyl-ACP methyl ester carboxylesterase/lysophospholipase L1-like esterase
MKMRHRLLLIGICSLMAGKMPAAPAADTNTWHGFQRLNFSVDGRSCLLVVPETPASGKPWIWRTEFFNHQPQADLALLSNGWHVAYVNVQNLYGAPVALDHMDRFYEHLTNRFQLNRKVALEGFSRGGLFAFNWAARNSGSVASIYVDAPVCDFKSWPAGWGKGKGSSNDWVRCKQAYGLNDEQARACVLNPVDNLAPLARARIPIISVCGDADDVVPMAENTLVVKERYEKLGGEIQVITKPGVGHHPHSLSEPKPIVDFILRYSPSTTNSSLFAPDVRRVVFLGDSITYAGAYISDIVAYHRSRAPGCQIEFINLGLSSETASGLSEERHAGGKFPRPDVHERLARVLGKTKPDLVIACYGMNDGIYLPFDESRFQAFRDGITRLHDAVEATGGKIIHVTPPVFDEARGGHAGYADVLDRYSDWLVAQRAAGWQVIDLHKPMSRALADERTKNPEFAFAKDSVHPDDQGHWFMARVILAGLGATDLAGMTNPAALFPDQTQGANLLRLIQQQQSVMKDAWLTEIGHKRPQKSGLPIPEAQRQAAAIETEIQTLLSVVK